MKFITLLLVSAGIAAALEPMPVPPNLANVRRIFIDKLSGGAGADQMRDMIIAALMKSQLFLLTENSERADAFLRGTADDQVYEEDHSSSDSIGIHATSGSGSSFACSTRCSAPGTDSKTPRAHWRRAPRFPRGRSSSRSPPCWTLNSRWR